MLEYLPFVMSGQHLKVARTLYCGDGLKYFGNSGVCFSFLLFAHFFLGIIIFQPNLS